MRKNIIKASAILTIIIISMFLITCEEDNNGGGNNNNDGTVTFENHPGSWSCSVIVSKTAEPNWRKINGVWNPPEYDNWYSSIIGEGSTGEINDYDKTAPNIASISPYVYTQQNGVWLNDNSNDSNGFTYTGTGSVYATIYNSNEYGQNYYAVMNNIIFDKGAAKVDFNKFIIKEPALDPQPYYLKNDEEPDQNSRIVINIIDNTSVNVNVTGTGGTPGKFSYELPEDWVSFSTIKFDFEISIKRGNQVRLILQSGMYDTAGAVITNPEVANSQYLNLTRNDTSIEFKTTWIDKSVMNRYYNNYGDNEDYIGSGITFQVNNNAESNMEFTFKVTSITFIP